MAVLQREIEAVSAGTQGIVGFDEAGFQKNFVYKSNASPKTVIAHLSSLRSMDKKIEEKRKRFVLISVLSPIKMAAMAIAPKNDR